MRSLISALIVRMLQNVTTPISFSCFIDSVIMTINIQIRLSLFVYPSTAFIGLKSSGSMFPVTYLSNTLINLWPTIHEYDKEMPHTTHCISTYNSHISSPARWLQYQKSSNTKNTKICTKHKTQNTRQRNKWVQQLRNDFNFWNVHGIMNTPGLLQTLQENRSIHDSMNRSKLNLLLLFTFYYKYLNYNKLFLI